MLMTRMKGALIAWSLIFLSIGCSSAGSQNDEKKDGKEDRNPRKIQDERFMRYWNQGKGELTRYRLEQARYGEIHHGDAVLIFVTEDFLTDKQVKLESEPKGRPYAQVLKLNFVKKFVTGIYPYSMMTSIFTPVETYVMPHTLKVTTSVQEWCGNVFTQFNLANNSYNVEGRSYFEREGDTTYSLEGVTLEDELWTLIRLDPKRLPTGSFRIIPGTMASRLRHTPLVVMDAEASLAPGSDSVTGSGMMRYTLTYKDGGRTLAIDFRNTFPYEILGWTETYKDGFGPDARMLTTRATRTNSIMLDYWSKHTPADSVYRRELGLDTGHEGS
jgi:hypothetical protein